MSNNSDVHLQVLREGEIDVGKQDERPLQVRNCDKNPRRVQFQHVSVVRNVDAYRYLMGARAIVMATLLNCIYYTIMASKWSDVACSTNTPAGWFFCGFFKTIEFEARGLFMAAFTLYFGSWFLMKMSLKYKNAFRVAKWLYSIVNVYVCLEYTWPQALAYECVGLAMLVVLEKSQGVRRTYFVVSGWLNVLMIELNGRSAEDAMIYGRQLLNRNFTLDIGFENIQMHEQTLQFYRDFREILATSEERPDFGCGMRHCVPLSIN